jgi:16S rRNA A1518/A1519 N6-dimethyltransferase RsmA/KsgA/DIM1 with predicted DNA glycosylase/AP lyase activity
MLSKTLRDLYPGKPVQEILEKMGKSPKCRPEELSLDDFLELFSLLNAIR